MSDESLPWLNNEMIEKILNRSENDPSIKVMKTHIKTATEKGDNYASDIFRVSATYTCGQDKTKNVKTKSIILKVAPSSGSHMEGIVIKANFFETETSMMFDTSNKMNQVLGQNVRFGARGLFSHSDKPVFLALEDLSVSGYKLAERKAGLDLQHCVLAFQNLAKFHAASVLLVEKDPELKKRYAAGIFSEKFESEIPEEVNFWIEGAKSLAKVLLTWLEADKRYSEKMFKLSDKMFKIGMQSSKFNENDFNVICHNDYWRNNMMFNYDESGKPIGHIMVRTTNPSIHISKACTTATFFQIDFQLCYYGSPAIDLLYFCNNSVSEEVYYNHCDDIIKTYYQTLCDTMKRVECKTSPLSFESLQQSLKDRAAYGMVTGCIALPIMMVDKKDAKSIDELLTEKAEISVSLKNPRFGKVILKRLEKYDKMALLDL